MNNAWILHHESDFQHREAQYEEKAAYLHEIAYRMARPFGTHKYQRTDPRKAESKVMINMVFQLTDEEKLAPAAPTPAAPEDDSEDDPEDAPEDAPAAAAGLPPTEWDLPTEAQINAAAAHGYVMPKTIEGAVRKKIAEARPPVTPYLGGRWESVKRLRCTLCPKPNNFKGQYMCEMPACGHRNLCIHHSVVLCQDCFRRNNTN